MSEHDLKGRAASRLISTQPTGGATDLAASGPPAERDPIDRVSSRLGDASCANAHASALDLPHRMERSSTHSALLRLQRRYGNRFVGQVLDRARDEGPSEGRLELVERSIEQARGGGLGLDHRTQGQMESAFGADFSGVRIHTDSRADSLNHSLSARAFATGRDVFSVSMESGIVNQIELLGRSYAAADTSHYTVGRRFDVVYTKSPLKAFPFGVVKQCKFDGEVALSPLYGVFTPTNRHAGFDDRGLFRVP